MKHGIVAGFGDPIPASRLVDLKGRGFDLVRTTLQKPEYRDACVAAIRAADLQGLYIVTSLDELAAVPEDGWVELGNEPQIGDVGQPARSPHDYADWALPMFTEASARGLRVYCGAINEITPGRLAWLADVLQRLPFDCVAIHRYPRGSDQHPETSAWPSRGMERVALGHVLGSRRFIVSETGNQAATYWRWFWRHRVSEMQRLTYLKQETAYWAADPQCDGVVIYQEWTGNPATDPYGLRGSDWAWKPVGSVWL